jgi:hypothetical protein
MPGDRPMTPFRITLALVLVMVAVLLAAGCDNILPEYNLVLIKLHPDGSVGWSKIFEDKAIQEMVETSDGSYIITYMVVTHRPEYVPDKFSRLSKNGDQVWERSVPGSGDFQCLNKDMISTTENGFATAAARGGVCLFDADGNAVWDKEASAIYYHESIVQTRDGGFFVIGDHRGNTSIPTNAKLDNNGILVWENTFQSNEIEEPYSTVELPDDSGFLVAYHGKYQNENHPLYIVRLDEKGVFLNTTLLSPNGWFTSEITKTASDEFVILYRNYTGIYTSYTEGNRITNYLNNTNSAAIIDRKGEVKKHIDLSNDSVPTISTPEGGYLFAGFSGNGTYYSDFIWNVTDTTLHVVKLDSLLKPEWEKEISDIKVNSIGKIVPTKDGGYLILCARLKEKQMQSG